MTQDFAFYLDTFSEVYQQAYFYAGGFQVVNELGAVGRMEVFDGFQFEDDFVFNEDIGSVFSNQLVIIKDFNSFFFVGVETGFCQFDQEGVLVDGFKEAESEGVVDFVGARYYFGG